MSALELDHHMKNGFDRLRVADKVVIDREDAASIAEGEQRRQLIAHRCKRLRSGKAAVELNDVAEVASESAADSGLHHHRPVVAHVDQVPPRRWHIAKLLEDRPIIERLSRTGCLRRNRRRDQDDGRIIGMTPPLAL